MSSRRWIITLLVAAGWAGGWSRAGAAEIKPELQQAIKELGAPDFATREAASQRLWASGQPAVPALQVAAQSTDPEVAFRARQILEQLKYGILPGTPEEIRQLLQRYHDGNPSNRQAIIQELFNKGDTGREYLLRLAANEPDFERRVVLFNTVMMQVDFDALSAEPAIKEHPERLVNEVKFWTAIFPEDITLPLASIRRLDEVSQPKAATEVFNAALQAQQRLLSADPKDPERHNNLAWLCAVSRRELDKARRHAETAVNLAPRQAAYRDTLAEVYFQQGDTARAKELIAACVASEPEMEYYRAQQERFEKGDRSVPPPEPF